MIPDDIGLTLHDRATRGESLTAEEQELLRRWYAHHDQEEMSQLHAAPVPNRLADLQARVQQVTAQVVMQARHIETLTAENAQLRQEIASLLHLLSDKPTGQPA
jgi:flagellar motor protein MotB